MKRSWDKSFQELCFLRLRFSIDFGSNWGGFRKEFGKDLETLGESWAILRLLFWHALVAICSPRTSKGLSEPPGLDLDWILKGLGEFWERVWDNFLAFLCTNLRERQKCVPRCEFFMTFFSESKLASHSWPASVTTTHVLIFFK